MSREELAVVIVCAVVGYAIVAWLMNRKSKPEPRPQGGFRQQPPPEPEPEPEPEPQPQPEPARVPWYRTLEVSPSASAEDIQRAYRRLISQYHPDKVASLGDELKVVAERKSKEITGAYREGMRLRGARS